MVTCLSSLDSISQKRWTLVHEKCSSLAAFMPHAPGLLLTQTLHLGLFRWPLLLLYPALSLEYLQAHRPSCQPSPFILAPPACQQTPHMHFFNQTSVRHTAICNCLPHFFNQLSHSDLKKTLKSRSSTKVNAYTQQPETPSSHPHSIYQQVLPILPQNRPKIIHFHAVLSHHPIPSCHEFSSVLLWEYAPFQSIHPTVTK